jgi:uncharacterized protein (TIGR02147 family)
MKPIVEYLDYTEYLEDWFNSRPKKGHGQKGQMAQSLGVIPTQVSRVLKKEIHFTLDQAAKAVSFLELAPLEGHYFFGLVELARAGSNEMRELIRERLDELKSKFKTPEKIDFKQSTNFQESQETYFSSYLYNAIELITNIERYQTPESICRHFNISKKRAMEVLNFLVKIGTVKRINNKFVRTKANSLHKLDENFLKINTANWRNRAIASLNYDDLVNFHQNINFTITEKNIPKIKKFLFDAMIEMSQDYITEDSDDSQVILCSFCLDLFEIK